MPDLLNSGPPMSPSLVKAAQLVPPQTKGASSDQNTTLQLRSHPESARRGCQRRSPTVAARFAIAWATVREWGQHPAEALAAPVDFQVAQTNRQGCCSATRSPGSSEGTAAALRALAQRRVICISELAVAGIIFRGTKESAELEAPSCPSQRGARTWSSMLRAVGRSCRMNCCMGMLPIWARQTWASHTWLISKMSIISSVQTHLGIDRPHCRRRSSRGSMKER